MKMYRRDEEVVRKITVQDLLTDMACGSRVVVQCQREDDTHIYLEHYELIVER